MCQFGADNLQVVVRNIQASGWLFVVYFGCFFAALEYKPCSHVIHLENDFLVCHNYYAWTKDICTWMKVKRARMKDGCLWGFSGWKPERRSGFTEHHAASTALQARRNYEADPTRIVVVAAAAAAVPMLPTPQWPSFEPHPTLPPLLPHHAAPWSSSRSSTSSSASPTAVAYWASMSAAATSAWLSPTPDAVSPRPTVCFTGATPRHLKTSAAWRAWLRR